MELYDSSTRTSTRFNGVQLAQVSSREDDSLRWTEIGIYRTDAGKYVIHVVGRSRVYHRGEADGCDTGTPLTVTEDDPPQNHTLLPCPKCKPYADLEIDDLIRVETDRETVRIAEDPQGVHEALQARGEGGLTYMSKLSRRALSSAAELDSALRVRIIA